MVVEGRKTEVITVAIEVRPRRNRRGEVSTTIPQQNPLYPRQKPDAPALGVTGSSREWWGRAVRGGAGWEGEVLWLCMSNSLIGPTELGGEDQVAF